MATSTGWFITFEGPEGGGKSSQCEQLARRLEGTGHLVLQTKEPGGTVIGRELRAMLLMPERPAPAPNAAALLISADRAQHVQEVIRPALSAGMVVISDRYADSTLAYQGFGDGLSFSELEQITKFATGGLRPDLTILIDLDVRVGLARRRAAFKTGEGELNRIDRRDVAFHQRVRDGYLALAKREPERFVVVNGELPMDQAAEGVWRAVSTLLLLGETAENAGHLPHPRRAERSPQNEGRGAR